MKLIVTINEFLKAISKGSQNKVVCGLHQLYKYPYKIYIHASMNIVNKWIYFIYFLKIKPKKRGFYCTLPRIIIFFFNLI